MNELDKLGQLVMAILVLIFGLIFYGIIGLVEVWAIKKVVRWYVKRRTERQEREEMEANLRVVEAERIRQAQAKGDADVMRQALGDLMRIHNERRNTSVTVRRVD